MIGCAIKVHRRLGPGLFESVYQPCLAYELAAAGLHFDEQVAVPLKYEDLTFARTFRADLVVEHEIIVEVKAVEVLAPVHSSQILTYMRLAGIRKGLLINFNVSLLKNGIKSFVI